MIQRISAFHLEQLSAEQQEKLRSRWTPQEGEYIFFSGQEEMVYYLNGVEKHRSLPLLTVGQMIAFLHELEDTLIVNNAASNEWVIQTSTLEWKAAELCDALWDAVKSLL